MQINDFKNELKSPKLLFLNRWINLSLCSRLMFIFAKFYSLNAVLFLMPNNITVITCFRSFLTKDLSMFIIQLTKTFAAYNSDEINTQTLKFLNFLTFFIFID